MKLITKQQIIKFNALLGSIGWAEEQKRDIIATYTNGRSDRTKDMHFAEAKEMIEALAKLAGEIPSPQLEHERRRVSEDKMRKKVISLAYQLGWTLPNGKLNYDRLNSFIASHPVTNRPECKTLNDHRYAELVLLISQFEMMVSKLIKKFK
jgi:hypothetical protein